MKTVTIVWLAALVVGVVAAAGFLQKPQVHLSSASPQRKDKVVLTDADWKKKLTPTQYAILRKEDTESAFTGPNWENHHKGTYSCAGCGLPLFKSSTKFDSGTGWPSFYQPISDDAVWDLTDDTFGMHRIEVRCARCDGHLGHVFDDGPKPTGLRYCMNGGAMVFKEDK